MADARNQWRQRRPGRPPPRIPNPESQELRLRARSRITSHFWPADPSRLAASLVGRILPVCSLLAPCQAGASTPKTANLFFTGPLLEIDRRHRRVLVRFGQGEDQHENGDHGTRRTGSNRSPSAAASTSYRPTSALRPRRAAMWVALSPTRIPFSSSKSRTGRLMAPVGTLVGGGLSTAAVAEPAAPSVTARSSRTTIVPTTTAAARNTTASTH